MEERERRKLNRACNEIIFGGMVTAQKAAHRRTEKYR